MEKTKRFPVQNVYIHVYHKECYKGSTSKKDILRKISTAVKRC